MSFNNKDIVIKVENVTKEYKIYQKPIHKILINLAPKFYEKKVSNFKALNNISLEIPKGTTVGIVGRNGSGKSTLLQIITGTLNPTLGNVNINGRISALLELGAGFNPEFTGRENVYLNGAILGLSRKEIDEKFDSILEFSEIGEFIDRPVKTYSSGMFVRLAFSVAAFVDPDIMIIDEALSVGDEKFQRKCYNYLENLKEKGCTILFVSHSMRVVEQLCDYAYLLDNSNLIAEGEPKEIIDKYHMLLYSQENAHYQALNAVEKAEKNIVSDGGDTTEEHIAKIERDVFIENVKMLNEVDEEAYVFNTGKPSKIVLTVHSSINVQDVLIGLRIKTTQGIEVYGTSTSYHKLKIDFKKNKQYTISFDQKVRLTSGTYHISVAIAKEDGKNDMIYFDKLSDFLLFKVEELPISGTGIANLNSSITIKEV
ncbi:MULTISPECIES: ABC transporter ATP-binding protein [Lysinibacillus]|uniref:ABC transporter ATP-binding protein n=1 Tax=Lysinibacillus TaxID=400634 RepID=UPI001CBBF2B4|nr:ABC transporter ATP-binding protein [Lysinibacillus sphaericus]